MVDIDYNQAGGFREAVASSSGEYAAGSDVGQCLLL